MDVVSIFYESFENEETHKEQIDVNLPTQYHNLSHFSAENSNMTLWYLLFMDTLSMERVVLHKIP